MNKVSSSYEKKTRAERQEMRDTFNLGFTALGTVLSAAALVLALNKKPSGQEENDLEYWITDHGNFLVKRQN